MLRLLTILFFALCALPQVGRAQSVTIFEGTVYEALDEAKESEKLLLLEFLAPWSRKSSWMHDVILKSEVAARSFIVYSVDTGGELGAAMAQQYSVTSYPFLVVFNAKGDALLKLDKTFNTEDFDAQLSEILLAQSGNLVWELETIYRIATSATSLKPSDAERLEQIVEKYLREQGREHLLAKSHWDIFSSSVITHYGSSSFEFLRDNLDEFFDVELARDKFNDIVYGVLIGAVANYETTVKEDLLPLLNDTQTLTLTPYASGIIELLELREAGDAIGYIYKLERIVDNLNESYRYQLVMTLNWTAPLLSDANRTSRVKARKMVENLLLETDSPAKISLIESLLCEF